jgi:hypothetical protein
MRSTLLLLVLFPVLASAGGIVWSDRNQAGTRAIRAANLDGTNPHLLFDLGTTLDPRGVVIVPSEGRIYYGTRSSAAIYRANLDGSGSPVAIVSSGLNQPSDLRYLPPGSAGAPGTLYLADESGGAIRRVLTDGTGLTTLISTSVPYYLDLDPAGGKIYWGNNGTNLVSGPIAGGPADPPLYTSGQSMRGVCVDVAGGMLYWCDRQAKAVRRRPIAGGTVQDVYTNLDTPHGLVLDLPAGKMYWADTGTNGSGFNGKGISRGDLDGSSAAEALVTSANSLQAWDLDLDTRTPSYAEWRMRFFRKDANAAVTGLAVDPDGDGAKNVLEYALGFGPMNAGSVPMAEGLRVSESSIEYPAIRFRRRVAASDVVYRVQVSTNLTEWTDNSITPGTTVEVGTPGAAADGMEVATVRSTTPISAAKQFLRVWVQAP